MNLDKNKFYCQSCLKNGKITELHESINNKNILETTCEHKGRYFSYISWCDKCKDFTSHRGFNKNALCYRCIMKKNCQTAIDKGLHSCQNPETSLSNPKIHAKTIKSQIENGSFNMMNDETYKKAMKNKMKKYSSGSLKCNKCGKENKILNSFGLCSECQSKIAVKNRAPKYCNSCKCVTPHNGNVCLICHPESSPTGGGFCSKEWKEYNFNIDCNILCSKYNSCNNKDRFKKNKWGYCNLAKNYLPNFVTSKDSNGNDLLYYFDKNTFNCILWEDYKEKFKTLNVDFVLPDGFKIYPTFRTQDSESWEDAKSYFEQNLSDSGINWFCYIKFYIDKYGKIKPLVVGKSGSILVNVNGSDVNFSEDPNDGPARRFLKENGYQWCKTQIAIYNCYNEKEAYAIENKISKNFNLFES